MSRRGAAKLETVVAPQAPEDGLTVGYLMGRARASLLSGLDTQLERFGLSGMQFAVLKHLAEGSARTAAELCRFMQYDTGAMTRIVDRLEERGLVRRERSREDRRAVVLRLAPSGRTQLPTLASLGAPSCPGSRAWPSACSMPTWPASARPKWRRSRAISQG